jgi:hypothetical protein
MMKMANAFHTLLFVTASTIRPTARSLEATCALGVIGAGLGAVGVILAERHEHEVGNRAVAVHLLKLFDEAIRAEVVARARELSVGSAPLELGISGALLEAGAANFGDTTPVAHAEGLHRQPLLPGELPDVGSGLVGNAFTRVDIAVARVAQRPRALGELGGIRRRRPRLAVL